MSLYRRDMLLSNWGLDLLHGKGHARAARNVRSGDSESDRIFRFWIIAWLGGSALGIVNGVARELLYKDQVGDQAAHYISTATLVALLAFYMWVLERRRPIPSRRTAIKIGGMWLLLTILFEFGFGHYVDGKPWSVLLRDYDVTDGRVWSLVVIWIGIGPSIVRGLQASNDGGARR
jgi:uncharacterized membrane protein (UPF0136 family)